jgi:hypothetical protein
MEGFLPSFLYLMSSSYKSSNFVITAEQMV